MIPTTHTGTTLRWLVSEDSAGLFPSHTGTAASEAAAWTAAYTIGREALLNGTIRHLCIAVDDEIPTFGFSPGRDHHGQLNPGEGTQYLDELLFDTLRSITH